MMSNVDVIRKVEDIDLALAFSLCHTSHERTRDDVKRVRELVSQLKVMLNESKQQNKPNEFVKPTLLIETDVYYAADTKEIGNGM